MEVTLAVLADGANVTQDGKLNILGVFHALGASSYPATHPQMFLVVCFEADRSEEGKNKKVEIQLADEDGNRLFAVEAAVVVPNGPPGQRIRMNQILALNNVRFPKAGDFVFNILIGDDHKASVELKLVEAKMEQRTSRT